MKKLTVILVLLCTLLLLSGCVTAKKANELVDERLQVLYPDIDFEVLNSRTITLAEKQAEIEEAVTLANRNINSALDEGISRIDLKATETEQNIISVSERTEQFIESISQQAQQSIKEKTDSAERSLHTITIGATEELNKSLASVKQQLNTTVSGSVSTVTKKVDESVAAVNKAVSDAQTTMQTTVSGSISTVTKKAEESVAQVTEATTEAQQSMKTLLADSMSLLNDRLTSGEQTMHTLVTGSVIEIENARLKAQQNINTLISGGLEQIRTASKLEVEAITAIEDALKAELSAAKQSTMTEISGHRAQASDAYKAYEEKVQTAFTEIDVMKKNTETFLKGLEVQYKDFILGLIKNEGQALYDDIMAEKDVAITSIQTHQKATEQKIDATESYMSGLKVEFQKHVEEQVAIIEELKTGIQEDLATYRSSVDTMSHGTIQRINETADNLNSKFTSLEKQYESLVIFLQGLSKLQ
ncbi:hypothetical protein [Sphaerochaeta sp.]|uniref:hypothetical protein n=1 Tax=Sphaerochaeta sp. TaxID=1972642 RepID=UPI000AFAE62D|nr:hypothetical protein [Sphaerochaeta sp.]MDD3456591.1 hypothetical protein [Sphaerochaeta sp.]